VVSNGKEESKEKVSIGKVEEAKTTPVSDK
jgi:hypothetical protein